VNTHILVFSVFEPVYSSLSVSNMPCVRAHPTFTLFQADTSLQLLFAFTERESARLLRKTNVLIKYEVLATNHRARLRASDHTLKLTKCGNLLIIYLVFSFSNDKLCVESCSVVSRTPILCVHVLSYSGTHTFVRSYSTC
jgi:hypothetical protein